MFERLKALRLRLDELRLTNNSIVYRQGEPCAEIYFVVEGHVKLSRLNLDGDSSTIAILPAGELCGALLTGQDTSRARDTATAKGKARLYRIPRAALVGSVLQDTNLAEHIIDCMARRQHFLERRLELLLNREVDGRVAGLLIELARDYGGHCNHGHEVDMRLTQQELADLAGASRPVVSTILNRLRGQGLISYTREYICIDNLRLLKSIALYERN